MKWIIRIASLVVLWGAVGAVIWYVDPLLVRDVLIPSSYAPFFLLLWLALGYTVGVLLGTTMMVGVVLSAMGIMHLGLLIVLLLTLLIESWYIYKKR